MTYHVRDARRECDCAPYTADAEAMRSSEEFEDLALAAKRARQWIAQGIAADIVAQPLATPTRMAGPWHVVPQTEWPSA